MISRDEIEKINEALVPVDKTEIARKAGVHRVTVYNFFGGKEDTVGYDTQSKIVNAALKLIEKRQKREKAIAKKTNSLLK